MLRKAEPTGPPAGTVVNHFGFVFKDLPAALALWKARQRTNQTTPGNPNQGYVHAPDGVRVEFFGDPALTVPVKIVPHSRLWRGHAGDAGMVCRGFGRRARHTPAISTPGWIACDFFPGMNYSFSSEHGKLLRPIRSLNHIGFDVTNLYALVKRLAAQGIAIEAPPAPVPELEDAGRLPHGSLDAYSRSPRTWPRPAK